MTAKELREKYLEFFKARGHAVIPSASLVPQNDPTVLFTTAGMHPLVPYLLGEKHPEGKRLVSVQRCLRTSDIEEVGDDTHLTFFEMLGNWSLGDYFKKEAIEWSWEFLTLPEYLGLDKNRLAVSVFAGDNDAPFDEEAFEIWKSLGISEKRIARLPKENNWWGPAGQTGPCGPDTEIFYWTGDPQKVPEGFNDDNDLWVEIWNNVFMQYNKTADGRFEALAQKNVDTGMGLERMLMIKEGKKNVYDTKIFCDLMNKIDRLSNLEHGNATIQIGRMSETKNKIKSKRIIADHVRAVVFMISDGVIPSNTGRGYVLRKIIRRAMRHMGDLIIEKGKLVDLVEVVIRQYKDVYENISKNEDQIKKEISGEEEKAGKSLEEGLKAFRAIEKNKPNGESITGEEAIYLYQTCSLPVDQTKELAREYGRDLSSDFDKIVEEKTRGHEELSRKASAGIFKGGLADHSEQTVKYHTAAHLLLAALRKVLGPDVNQRGANITSERLRFDFSYPQKLTPEQIKEVEDLVNEKIKEDLPVVCEEMELEKAKQSGATGIFDSKYGERVKVYTIGPSDPFSKEICGGPHVERTGVLGNFKIVKEESCSAGVRRIKAILA